MNDKKTAKNLGIILCVILGIIFLILISYFTSEFLKVKDPKIKYTSSTTTKNVLIDEGYQELDLEEKKNFNNEFSNNTMLIAFNNAFDNNYNLMNINLLETETSKFKYLYTYIKLNNLEEEINFDIINKYSNNLFLTNLYSENFSNYLVDNYYSYEIKYMDIDYCLKVNKKKENSLFIDMIERSEEICDINIIDYDSSLIRHQIRLGYQIINNDYIYNSFVVVK